MRKQDQTNYRVRCMHLAVTRTFSKDKAVIQSEVPTVHRAVMDFAR